MEDCQNIRVSVRIRLLQALDCVQRTSWSSRKQDTEVAARVFDTWLTATEKQAYEDGGRDRMALLETLYAAFSDRHGVEAAQHLCVIFDVAFEAHVCPREDGGRGARRQRRSGMSLLNACVASVR